MEVRGVAARLAVRGVHTFFDLHGPVHDSDLELLEPLRDRGILTLRLSAGKGQSSCDPSGETDLVSADADWISGEFASTLDWKQLRQRMGRYLRCGDSWTARWLLEQALRVPGEPTPEVLDLCGLVYQLQELPEKAWFFYQRVVESGGRQSVSAANSVAMLYARHLPSSLRDLKRAEQYLDVSCELMDKLPDSENTTLDRALNHNSRSYVMLLGGRELEAVSLSRTALDSLPAAAEGSQAHAILANNFARLLLRLESGSPEIETLFRAAVEMEPRHPEFRLDLAMFLAGRDRTAEALVEVVEADRLTDVIAEIPALKGFLLQKSGNHEAAADEYLRALNIDPGQVENLVAACRCFSAVENYPRVIELATSFDTSDADASLRAQLSLLVLESRSFVEDLPVEQVRLDLEELQIRFPESADVAASRAYLAGTYDALLDAMPVIFAAALIVAVQISSGLVATAQLAGILVASRLIVVSVTENLVTLRVVQTGLAVARGIDDLIRDTPDVNTPDTDTKDPSGTIDISGARACVTVHTGQRVALIGSDAGRLLRGIVVPDNAADGYQVRYSGDVQWIGLDHRAFDGTVAHVTTLWDVDSDDSRYVDAVQRAGLDGELAARTAGDATLLSSTGRVLSDGQSVRLGLAQAVYGGADIFLLADIFESLDAKTADTVAGRLFTGNRSTWLFTTTRPELLRHADVVLVAANGTLAALSPSRLAESDGEFDLDAVLGSNAGQRLRTVLAEPACTPAADAPVPAAQFRQADLADTTILAASLDTYDTEPERPASAPGLLHMIFGSSWSTVMILAAAVAILGELYLATNNGGVDRTRSSAVALYGGVAVVVLAAYLVRHLVAYRGSVAAVDGLHRAVLARVLRVGDTTEAAAIGGRVGRDFVTAETQAPRVLSLMAVGVASLALSIVIVALGDPITLIPSALLCIGLGVAYLRSRDATRAATNLVGVTRAPSVNFAVAAIGYLGFHSHLGTRVALSRRFDDLTAIRAVAAHRLQWVRLRLLLQIELVGAGFFVASAWAAPFTSGIITPAVLLYVAYSLTQQVIGVVERAQSGEIASRQVARLLALLDGQIPRRAELVRPSVPDDPVDAGAPASVTLSGVVVETADDARMTAAISFTCEPATMTWIQGPSGIGKSTLLDTVAGFRPPRSGTVTVGATTGHVTTLLVGSDLPLMAISVAELTTGARDVLDQVYALAGRAAPDSASVITDLSHQDRQLVALARAAALRPSLLLVDEATSTLEPHVERALLEFLNGQVTLLVVSHRPDNRDLADTIVTLTGDTALISYANERLANAPTRHISSL
jgi:ABC-type multidrug transport system fused ATPase/permease subunit/tetratricopeptide (TPR) repeat protein